ncbi:hypothetical protein C1645_842595 [Glomus cerebriforme]|uniref:Uncharacterized protein n=1 Tax=Glomus cerebriforme TaxID=658196 RepID=A0A397RZH8_9GLOM|nr:hypothetical protein C1645_842595 [Glomus cerebriforme]
MGGESSNNSSPVGSLNSSVWNGKGKGSPNFSVWNGKGKQFSELSSVRNVKEKWFSKFFSLE